MCMRREDFSGPVSKFVLFLLHTLNQATFVYFFKQCELTGCIIKIHYGEISLALNRHFATSLLNYLFRLSNVVRFSSECLLVVFDSY